MCFKYISAKIIFMKNSKELIVIIDGNSLINRAYYAMQRPMITKDGMYTQGIYGFLNMLEKIKKDYDPDYMVVAFDVKAPTFRHKQYEEYKAGRRKMPPELAMQIPVLKEVLDAMNIGMIEMEGFEADDLIGTISKRAEEQDKRVLIITGDKDALQLAGDNTGVLITRKGISQFDLYDRKAFVEKYGFEPINFIDCKALMGDQSDNIPGVPGIGEKGATKLICQYATIEEIYEKIDEVEPKGTRTKLMDNYSIAFMSKRLATINRNVPIETDFEKYRCVEADYAKLIEIYKRLEFNSFLKRLDIPQEQSKNQELETYKVKVIGRDISEDDFLKEITGKEPVGLRIYSDHSHMKAPELDAFAVFAGNTVFCGHDFSTLVKLADRIDETKTYIYGHGIKNEIYDLMHIKDMKFFVSFDTEIAGYVLEPSASDHSLETMAAEELGVSMKQEKEGQIGMFEDFEESIEDKAYLEFAVINRLMEIQKERLKAEELTEVFEDAELPLIEVMASMEKVGFTLDQSYLKKLGDEFAKREAELTERIYQLAGEEFNIKSPAQLGPILFEKLGLKPAKKTKRGYATGAEVLEKVKDKHEIVPLILEYRKLTKLSGTYVDGLLPMVAEDGRIHAAFNQTVTATGRISSSSPNMQNIPIREEPGRLIRGAFVPANENYVLVGADYSQIELRVLAHMSGDEALIDSFNRGLDIHRATASRVMGIPEDEITSQQRSDAKAVNFGVIYGMSSFGLSSELGITRKDAEKYISDYFEKHIAVKEFMDEQVRYCKEHGYVKTILGRKRHIKEINASAYMVRQLGERLAMNTPIQGSAADIIKLAMIRVYNALRDMKSKLLLQVHDELIIETSRDELDQVKEILRDSMENAMKLAVKLVVDLNTGENWLDLK